MKLGQSISYYKRKKNIQNFLFQSSNIPLKLNICVKSYSRKKANIFVLLNHMIKRFSLNCFVLYIFYVR